MTRPLYPKRNPSTLEPQFGEHMLGLTVHGMESKADIAIQLAWRDKRIAELEALVESLRVPATKWDDLIRSLNADAEKRKAQP